MSKHFNLIPLIASPEMDSHDFEDFGIVVAREAAKMLLSEDEEGGTPRSGKRKCKIIL